MSALSDIKLYIVEHCMWFTGMCPFMKQGSGGVVTAAEPRSHVDFSSHYFISNSHLKYYR